MFDLNRRLILWTIGGRLRSNMYIPVYHTNRRPIKNTISLVKSRLVGKAFKAPREARVVSMATKLNSGLVVV